MTDDTDRPDRVIDLSVEVPGTPEEVWQAIATGAGIGSWFIGHEVEEQAGGTVAMDFGDFGVQQAAVTAWEPPHRFEVTGTGERVLAHEWTVTALDGGTCVVRLVCSGFGPGEEWDADYDGMSQGWRLFLENLRLHRTHFAGRRAASLTPTGMADGPLSAAWASLCTALGVPAGLQPGETFETAGDGVPALRGRVATALDGEALAARLVVLDEPAGTGILAAEGRGDRIMVSFYQYRYGPDSAPPAGTDAEAWAGLFARALPFTPTGPS
jgi:uncharacterized protein YndB with AHSA1/START domain